MMFNDTYSTERWKEFCLGEWGSTTIRPHPWIPLMRMPILPRTYNTVVIELKKELSKKQRKLLRHSENQGGYSVKETDCDSMISEAIDKQGKVVTPKYYKGLKKTGARFFFAKNTERTAGLTIIPGKKWITECFAFGEQTPIKGAVIDEFKDDFEFYDLAGLSDDSNSPFWKFWRDKEKEKAVNTYKLRWGDPQEVRLK